MTTTLDTFPAGTCVRSTVGAGLTPAGTTGTVRDLDPSLMGDYDLAVDIDGRDRGPMLFRRHELERIPA